MAVHDTTTRNTTPLVGNIASSAIEAPVGDAPANNAPAQESIHYGGRIFSCSPEMASIFLRHAREVIESGDEELVPLLHSEGIELLFISRATPYSLVHSFVN